MPVGAAMTEQLRRSMVRQDATLADAMRSLDVSMTQIVLVVDVGGRFCGILTDGDIRRALLGGAALATSLVEYVNRDCFTVGTDAGRADVLELMQARHIAQVPVVDGMHQVVGVHLLHDLVTPGERPNWAVVMAGGKGTRLGKLTENTPKPMLRVAGRPILERIVLGLVGSGIRQVYLSVNYLADRIEQHFGDGHRFGCSIRYLHEREPLGTAGSLSLLPRGSDGPTDPIVVMNGDLVTQANVGRIIDYHELGDQALTMAVRQYVQQIPYGCVEVDGDELVGFVEKPAIRRLVNAGIYVMDPDCLQLLAKPEPFTMPDVTRRIQASGRVTRVFEIDDDWIDVGQIDQLQRARHGE